MGARIGEQGDASTKSGARIIPCDPGLVRDLESDILDVRRSEPTPKGPPFSLSGIGDHVRARRSRSGRSARCSKHCRTRSNSTCTRTFCCGTLGPTAFRSRSTRAPICEPRRPKSSCAPCRTAPSSSGRSGSRRRCRWDAGPACRSPGLPSHPAVEPDRQRSPALQRFALGAPVHDLAGRGCRSAHALQLSCWIS